MFIRTMNMGNNNNNNNNNDLLVIHPQSGSSLTKCTNTIIYKILHYYTLFYYIIHYYTVFYYIIYKIL